MTRRSGTDPEARTNCARAASSNSVKISARRTAFRESSPSLIHAVAQLEPSAERPDGSLHVTFPTHSECPSSLKLDRTQVNPFPGGLDDTLSKIERDLRVVDLSDVDRCFGTERFETGDEETGSVAVAHRIDASTEPVKRLGAVFECCQPSELDALANGDDLVPIPELNGLVDGRSRILEVSSMAACR